MEETTKLNIETEEESTEQEVTYIFDSYDDYSEDLAWVKFSDEINEYWGCIDKTGCMVFSFDASSILEVTPFSNGYAYLIYEDSIKVVNKTGNIESEYKIDDENTVLKYGDGFVLTQEYKADFDSSVYTFNICDAKGNVMNTFSLDEMKEYYSFEYFGKGVFGYYLSAWDWKIYLSDIDKWVNYNPAGNRTFYFYENTALTKIEYGGGFDSDDGFRGKLNLLSLDGKYDKVVIPENCGWNWTVGPVVGNICILHEFMQNYLVSYDLKSGKFAKMKDSYAEKLIYDQLPEPLEFNNGIIALPMKGSDGNRYVGVFDTKWDMIMDPIQIDDYELGKCSDERIIVKTQEDIFVYDKSGNLTFKLSETEYDDINDYSDGVARIEGEYEPTYVDKEGKKLFEEVNMSKTIIE